MTENFDILKIIGNDYWLAVRIAKQRKHETLATKRNCPKDLYHYSLLPEKSASRCNVYTLFFVYFTVARLLVYAVPKTFLAG